MLKSIQGLGKGVGAAVAGLALSQAAFGAAQAAPMASAISQMSITAGTKDAALAPAGTYKLDDTHASVIAKVSHIGYSYSVFRFGDVAGTLTWDPANIAKSTLKVTVKTASIATPVKGFAEELAGDKYLKSAAFPEATFVSTAFRQTDATHGKVDGQFTLMGKTVPLTFDVELVGAGKRFGTPGIGVEAEGAIKGADFGLPAFFAGPIKLEIDVEFVKAP